MENREATGLYGIACVNPLNSPRLVVEVAPWWERAFWGATIVAEYAAIWLFGGAIWLLGMKLLAGLLF